MRKTLTFGGVPVEIEANLGTASFFQEFTGMNILEMSSVMSEEMKKIGIKVTPTTTVDELSKNPKLIENISPISVMSGRMIEIAKQLAFVMSVQAKYGKTKEDISRIRAELTRDDMLAWSFQFEPTAFTVQTYTELVTFWKAQASTTSIPKNA